MARTKQEHEQDLLLWPSVRRTAAALLPPHRPPPALCMGRAYVYNEGRSSFYLVLRCNHSGTRLLREGHST